MKIRHKQSGVELDGGFREYCEWGPCIQGVGYFACERDGSRYSAKILAQVRGWILANQEVGK